MQNKILCELSDKHAITLNFGHGKNPNHKTKSGLTMHALFTVSIKEDFLWNTEIKALT